MFEFIRRFLSATHSPMTPPVTPLEKTHDISPPSPPGEVPKAGAASQLKLESCKIVPTTLKEADVLALAEACHMMADYIQENKLKGIYDDPETFANRVRDQMFAATERILNFDKSKFPPMNARITIMLAALETAIPLLGINPNTMPLVILKSKLETIELGDHTQQANPAQVDTSATDELHRLLGIDSSHPTHVAAKSIGSPAASHTGERRLTAAQVMAEAKRLNSEHAAWSVIFPTLNPSNDTTISDLLIAIRGPHMFAPEVGLRVIQAGCEDVLKLNTGATAIEALAAARRSLDKIRGADRY